MENKFSYKDLKVWQEAMALAQAVYRLTDELTVGPDHDLASHMRQTALAIPTHIAAGHTRGKADFGRYLNTSLGSTSVLETQLIASQSLGLTEGGDCLEKIDVVKRMLFGLIKKVTAPATNS